MDNNLFSLSSAELAQAHKHLAACFVNGATVLAKQGEHGEAASACTQALEYDPKNAKALFRRAQVRAVPSIPSNPFCGQHPFLIFPVFCIHQCAAIRCHHFTAFDCNMSTLTEAFVQATYTGGTTLHLENAVKDLQAAAKHAPGDTSISTVLSERSKELAEQNRKDRRTFGGLFNRGKLYNEKDSVPDKIAARTPCLSAHCGCLVAARLLAALGSNSRHTAGLGTTALTYLACQYTT